MSAQALQDELATMPLHLGQPGAAWARCQAKRALGRDLDAEFMLGESGARLPARRQMSKTQEVAIAAGWARVRLEIPSLPISSELVRFLLLLSGRQAVVDAHLNELNATFRLSACSELQADIDQVGRALAAARRWSPPAGRGTRAAPVGGRDNRPAVAPRVSDNDWAGRRQPTPCRGPPLPARRPCQRWRQAQRWRQDLGPTADRLVEALEDEAETLTVRERWLASAVAGGSRRPGGA